MKELIVRNRVEQLAEAVRGLRGQMRHLLDEFRGGLAQRARNGGKEDEEADGSGQRRGKVQAATHPGDEGLQENRHRQRNRHRHDDERQAGNTPQDGHDQTGDDEGAPRDRRGDAKSARDGGRHVALILVFLAHGHHDGRGRGFICVFQRQGS